VTRKSTAPRAVLRVDLMGDERVAEEVILEVRALAQRYGLEMPEARVERLRVAGPKAKKPLPPRRPASRSRRASPNKPR